MKKMIQTPWLEIIMLSLISGLTYLPYITQFTYYRDDWYFLYGALVSGPQALIDVALHTRPIRGPLYALYFSLFGLNPLPYHITMYLTRLAGGLGALWLFGLMWKNKHQANFILASLFIVYPGFLWWVAGFEFQPYVLSVTLQVISIACTLKAISAASMPSRLGWTVSAILLGWMYLALVEYAIGMEFFRLLCVHLFVRRNNPEIKFVSSIVQTLKASALHLTVPVVFFLWYQFLFDNWRRAQDAGVQFAILFTSPSTLAWRLVDAFRSFLNVSLFAWIIPFHQNFYGDRLRVVFVGFVLAAFVVALLYVANKLLNGATHKAGEDEHNDSWRKELIWIGLMGTIGGVLPVILANRVVVFDRISQYTLPASLAGVLFLGGLLFSIFPKYIRMYCISIIFGLAALSHHGLAAQAASEEKAIVDFWWQMTWRAPAIRHGTTLVALYPGISYAEGNDVVWGPANFIYAAEYQGQSPVEVPISASRLESDSILEIINGNRDFQQTDLVIKNISATYNYKNLLILSQPLPSSCVRALDPRWLELSIYDSPFLHASYQNSKIENIVLMGDPPQPMQDVFGLEPNHGWCFFYQKANLARQQGDWHSVARLGDEAQKLGLHPADQIEWMPFLQAYAILGDSKQVKLISKKMNTEPFYKQQACENFKAMTNTSALLTLEMQSRVDELFCQ